MLHRYLLFPPLLVSLSLACGEVKNPTGDPDSGVVVGDGKFRVSLSDTELVVRQNTNIAIAVTVTRGDYAGDVVLSLPGLPAGVTAPDVTLLPGESEAEFSITAGAQAAHSGLIQLNLSVVHDRPLAIPLTLVIAGSPGQADTTFSDDGHVLFQSGFYPRNAASSILMDPDGGFVISAQNTEQGMPAIGYLARFTASGALNPQFGTGGVLKQGMAVHSVAVHPSGYLTQFQVAAGQHVTRLLTAAGTTDPSFADVPATKSSTLLAAPDGYFLETQAELTKYRLTGQVENTFGSGGTLTVGGRDFTLDSQGRLLSTADNTVSRHLASGATDTTFAGGTLAFPLPAGFSELQGFAVAVDGADGGFLCGKVSNGNNSAALTRFGPSGTVDSSFGVNGFIELNTSGACLDIQYLKDGRFLTVLISSGQPEVRMYNSDGTLHTPFANQGIFTELAAGGHIIAVDETTGKALLVSTIDADANTGAGNLSITRIWL